MRHTESEVEVAVSHAVAAERARITALVYRATEQRRAASESAWQNGDVAAAERHREAVRACEEIAQAIERGEG